MRDYLYLSHDPATQSIVASGLEFSDVVKISEAAADGIVLLAHLHEHAAWDSHSGFEYVRSAEIKPLCEEDIYSWGDVCWADFSTEPFPSLPEESVAELLYFKHRGRPLRDAAIPGLGNHYLAAAHDDGWRLVLYYVRWDSMKTWLSSLPLLDSCAGHAFFAGRECTVWVDGDGISIEDRSTDIDALLSRRQTKKL